MSAERLLGANPGECIAVEDSPAGVRAAKAAGMVCIAVLTDAVKRDDIKDADVKIDSLLDFTPELLRGFNEEDDVSVTGRRA